MSQQNTQVYLLSTPLDNDYQHTLYFANKTDQYNYFISKLVSNKFNLNCSYQKKDGFIRYPATADNLINSGCNYVMYKNSDHSDKWYYAFITDITHENNGYAKIYIETDVMQTWMFDYEIKHSFIEREHVNDDTIGLHTIPEGLETGEYVSCNYEPSKNVVFDNSNCCSVLVVSELLTKSDLPGKNTYMALESSIPNALYYIGCQGNRSLREMVNRYDDAGKGDSIEYVFVAPLSFFDEWTKVPYEFDPDASASGRKATISYHPIFEFRSTTTITKNDHLNEGYGPKNKKLLTYPFSYLQVSNNAGTIVNYNWEDFGPGDVYFSTIGTLSPGCSFKTYPVNYKNIDENFDEGINLGKLPIGCWSSDVYTNWLTQNSVNQGITAISSVGSIVAGGFLMATGIGGLAGAGMIVGGITGVANSLSQHYQHSVMPDQARGNTNCGDVNYQFSLAAITFKKISIKNEYAQVIDEFFNMYGYKVNRVKIPNTNHRENYWYTKTINVNILGAIPKKELNKIRDIYNNGVTFWKYPNNFRDYSVSNNIVS